MLIATLQIGFVVYVAILLALVLMESRMIYPGAYMPDSAKAPLNASESIETVEYRSTDNLQLRGRLLERPDTDRIVLFFHGNAQKAIWLDGFLMRLANAFNATTMIAEYRGFADDETPTEKGVLADCLAARDYLCDRFQKSPSDIILVGQSLGGGCAVSVASQGGAKALVLDRTFDSALSVAAGRYPFIPVRWLMKNRFDSLARITVYDGPLVSVHGVNDEVIPVECGRRLFEMAGGPKKWIELDDLGHLDAIPDELWNRIAAETNELIGQ